MEGLKDKRERLLVGYIKCLKVVVVIIIWFLGCLLVFRNVVCMGVYFLGGFERLEDFGYKGMIFWRLSFR